MPKVRELLTRDAYAPRHGFRVTVHREPSQMGTDRQHRHAFYEIVWILTGNGAHVTESFRHRVGAGDVLVLDPRRAHGYERPEGLNLVNVLLDPELIMELSRVLESLPGFRRLFVFAGEQWERSEYRGRLRLAGRDARDVTDWIDRMEIETHSDAKEAPFLAESWALQLVTLLSRRAEERLPLRGTAPSAPAGVNRLFSWIELHLEESVRVEDLARASGMSVRTLQRRFHTRVGDTPMRYLHLRRMARAERLLTRHPGVAVAEVATRCGFTDPNHFSAAVKRHFGAAPRELRKKRSY
ncbi:MAG: helix-turn-helix domain-containing protein [Kiritimatiellae bacterium]|jgi:AraC family L-rhamnose operon regulatory protein RhaS|nr:helix-turn-helix domain-containing protein [Kiritimatiellia bacterium]